MVCNNTACLRSKTHISKIGGATGFLDMIEALKWVKRNIESFGGDPNEITIAGQSMYKSDMLFITYTLCHDILFICDI